MIVLNLPAGERLQEHQVHERACLVVVSGAVEISLPDGETASGGPGLVAVWEPAERHEVAATEDSLLFLVLAPWPGVGHPSQPSS
jgi:quercetin dioxygenase-like cupin family protein